MQRIDGLIILLRVMSLIITGLIGVSGYLFLSKKIDRDEIKKEDIKKLPSLIQFLFLANLRKKEEGSESKKEDFDKKNNSQPEPSNVTISVEDLHKLVTMTMDAAKQKNKRTSKTKNSSKIEQVVTVQKEDEKEDVIMEDYIPNASSNS